MIATISLRFREQKAITTILGRFTEEGWLYDGFIPGPEYTTKSAQQSANVLGTNYVVGSVEKDQWFLLIFKSETAISIPEGIADIQVSGKKDAFFKANQPVYLESRIRTFPPTDIQRKIEEVKPDREELRLVQRKPRKEDGEKGLFWEKFKSQMGIPPEHGS
jgi:hypothetical protein